MILGSNIHIYIITLVTFPLFLIYSKRWQEPKTFLRHSSTSCTACDEEEQSTFWSAFFVLTRKSRRWKAVRRVHSSIKKSLAKRAVLFSSIFPSTLKFNLLIKRARSSGFSCRRRGRALSKIYGAQKTADVALRCPAAYYKAVSLMRQKFLRPCLFEHTHMLTALKKNSRKAFWFKRPGSV